MRKQFVTILLLITLVMMCGCSKEDKSNVIEGVVEAPVLSHICEVPGKIVELNVELGQEVKAGEVIARLDDSDAKYGLEQLETTLVKKKAVLAELNRGADPSQIKQGKNNITIAEKTYENTEAALASLQTEYDRQMILFNEGAVPQTVVDGIKEKIDGAERSKQIAIAQVDNAKQQLSLLTKGTHQEKIDSAKADIAQTESQIRQDKANLEKYQILASADGVVISKNYLLGDMVNPGYNLVELSSSGEKYVVSYLPVERLPEVTFGQEVQIQQGDGVITAVLCYIDVKSQYTPKEMQSPGNKNKESVKIKLKLPQDVTLIPGERVSIIFGE